MSTNTAYDRSGQNNNGTITGATPAIGKVGQALSFDGTDDTVSLSDMGTVESYPFTFSAWFKISSSDNRATIVSQDNSADEVQRVQLYYGGTGFCYNVRNGVSNEAEPCDNSMSVPDDQWHHAVGVSSASNDHKLYIDGTLLATSTNSVSAPAVDRATIGDWPEGTENNPEDYHATGLIDEVRIYNRALSAGEVQQLYNMSAVGFRCGDMLAYNGDNYTTVKMPATYGSQCWLGENLRTTKKPDGVTGITTYCNPSGCDSPWGRLYTWTTAMNGSTTATGCGAKIQGICPSGWHIPSDYTSCSGDDFPGLGSDSGPLKQAGTTNWTSPNTGATNASNLTVYPAGYWSSAFYYRGNYGIFWSSAEFNGANTFDRTLSYNDANFYRSYDSKGYGVSVRCVKD
jgi:uncharacterized protein (TIGR02145 family)